MLSNFVTQFNVHSRSVVVL